MRMILPLSLLAAASLAAATPALACSVVEDYRVPTNMELVAGADLILLATVAESEAEPDSVAEQQIILQPVAALKGTMPGGPQVLTAMIATDADAMLSNPYELREAHPQSYVGACTRYAFPRGSRVLFFLKSEGDHWSIAGGPFSRWAEDVLTDDAPWLTLVRFYVEILALPEADRTAALTARRNEYGAQGSDPVAQLLAADIDRQLAGPNPTWNSAMERMIDSDSIDAAADGAMEAAQAAADAADRAAGAADAAAGPADAAAAARDD